MKTLPQNFGAFPDVRKQLANTIPGLLLAAVLVDLTEAVPCWTVRTFVRAERPAPELRIRALSEIAADQQIDASYVARRAAEARDTAARLRSGRAATAAAPCAGKVGERARIELKGALCDLPAAPAPTYPSVTRPRLAALTVKARSSAPDAAATRGAGAEDWDDVIANLPSFGLLGLFAIMLDSLSKALLLPFVPAVACGLHHGEITQTAPREAPAAKVALAARAIVRHSALSAFIDVPRWHDDRALSEPAEARTYSPPPSSGPLSASVSACVIVSRSRTQSLPDLGRPTFDLFPVRSHPERAASALVLADAHSGQSSFVVHRPAPVQFQPVPRARSLGPFSMAGAGYSFADMSSN